MLCEVLKFVTERFREGFLNIETTYAGYWRNYIRFYTLCQVLNALAAAIGIHR
jgi:hypothetical protein